MTPIRGEFQIACQSHREGNRLRQTGPELLAVWGIRCYGRLSPVGLSYAVEPIPLDSAS